MFQRMDFATIVETYRWTRDSTPEKLRPSIGSDGDEMPLRPDTFSMSSEAQLDNLVTVREPSETHVNVSSDLKVDKRLPSAFVGRASKSDDSRLLGGMLERAKARYESCLCSNWYRPQLRARGKDKAGRKSRGNNINSSAQEITIAADGYCSSSTDIGAGLVIPGLLPSHSDSKPGKKKKPGGSTKGRPSNKRKQQQLNNRPESDDSACWDVPKASCSSNPPNPSDLGQRRTRRSQVERRKRRVCGIANDNNKDDGSYAEISSRFFPPTPTSILQKQKVGREEDCRHGDGIIDGTVDNCPATDKAFSRKRRNVRASKIRKDVVSNADPSSSNFPTAAVLGSVEGGSLSSVSDTSLERVPRKLRRSSCPKLDVNALGQRDIAIKDWVPPVSVHALIQEELYADPWKVLVACMLLNKTSGTQMRKVIWDVFALCPTPEAAVAVETEKLEEVIRSLGLQRKRACMIQKFSCDYLGKDWKNVSELHGIGKYAVDAYAIFCEGRWQEVKPEDHKLVDYWQYLHATDGVGYAFKDEREKVKPAII